MQYAHNATTGARTVHSLAELRMALEDKARGQRLAQMRKLRRLTQQQMSERLGVAYRTYQTWESGTMPEWPNIEKIAAFFKIRPEDWIGEDDIVLSGAPENGRSSLDDVNAKLDAILAHFDIDFAAETVERLSKAAQADLRRGADPRAPGDNGAQSGKKPAAPRKPRAPRRRTA